MKKEIEKKLQDRFSPLYLEVKDESHLHVGHANYRPGGNSHFAVTLVSSDFTNLNRVQRHQLVYACLAEELKAGVHALSLTTLAPAEWEESNESG